MKQNIDIKNPEIRERLRRLREGLGLSRADFARDAEVSYRTILDIENGVRDRIQERTLMQIAKRLGVNCEFLLTGRKSPQATDGGWRGALRAVLAAVERPATPLATAWIVGIVALTAAGLALTDHLWNQKGHAPLSPSRIRAQSHYIAGVNNLDCLYRDRARREFRQALGDDSTFAMAAVMLVHPEIAGERAERDSLLALARRHEDGLTKRQRLYLDAFAAWNRHDLTAAIAACEEMVEASPAEAEGYRLLGRFYDARADTVAAISALESAVKHDPRDGMSFNRLAYMYARNGWMKKALRTVDHYVRLSSTEPNPYDTRGDLLALEGRPEAAIASYQSALLRDPTFFASMQNLGCVLTLLGRYDEAGDYFRMMLDSEDAGARSRARWFLGMVEVYRGRFDQAEEALRKAMVADELDRQAYSARVNKMCALARLQCARGHNAEGIATYRAAMDTLQKYVPGEIAEWPVDYACLLSRADIEAAEALRDSIGARTGERDVDLSHVYWACDGWIQLRRGNADAACAAFEKAVKRMPIFQFRYPLGLAYLEAGRPEDAIRVFESCSNRYTAGRLRNAIWGVEMYYYLGRAYDEAGRPEDARTMYTKFLNTWGGTDDPSFEEIADARAQLAAGAAR